MECRANFGLALLKPMITKYAETSYFFSDFSNFICAIVFFCFKNKSIYEDKNVSKIDNFWFLTNDSSCFSVFECNQAVEYINIDFLYFQCSPLILFLLQNERVVIRFPSAWAHSHISALLHMLNQKEAFDL